MTKLEQARELVFSLPEEEQVLLNSELSNKLAEFSEAESRRIDETLQDRLGGPFRVIDDPKSHFDSRKHYFTEEARTLTGNDG